MQRRQRREGVGASGWRRRGGGPAARRARVSVPPAIGSSVPPRNSRPPRSRSLRPAPSALRLQSRRAPAAAAAAAARPPATLPLPLNSCAKYAVLRLRGEAARPLTTAAGAAGPPRTPSPLCAAVSTRPAVCVWHTLPPSHQCDPQCSSTQRSEAHALTLSPSNQRCVRRERAWGTEIPQILSWDAGGRLPPRR